MFNLKTLAHRVGLALGLCTLMALPASAGDDGNGYGYLRAVEGSATLMQAGSGTRTPAEINQPVLAGDRLWVPERSRVEIILADRNRLRIDGGSEVLLERLAASPETRDRGTVLRLLEGNVQLAVLRESLGDELPRIDTPNATVYVQDYGVYRIAADQQIFTEVVVREGRAEVVNDRGREPLRAGEQAFAEGSSRIDVESAGSYDSLERWAQRLDEEGGADSRYLDGDLRYAAAPLSRYGSWIDYEGSHYWRPRVEAGWRPYYNGRWTYTPSGNTWVSYDPWGYVPHHYGSWDYLPGYGWAWLPGRRWAPAWVYWYQGPSYTGWCPTGYYTRYYGSRWGIDFGFHLGVYGWAGGDWGLFGHWTFVSSDYWRGYRNGYRDGRRDDWRDGRHGGWRDRWDVRRYAVSTDDLRRRGRLDRGLITTDSRPLTPEVLENPRHAVEVLSRDPSARRAARDAGGELPDVNDFIARKPELPSPLRRAVVADGDVNQLDGTPLRPGTMGRRPETGRYPDGVRGAHALPDTPRDRDSGRAGVATGERGDRGDRGDRGGSAGATQDEPRLGRGPAVRSLPRDDGEGRAPSGARERGDQPRAARPVPGDPGGAPRPGREDVRTPPREERGGDAEGHRHRGGDEPRAGVRHHSCRSASASERRRRRRSG